jgi:Xaa-Pro aminopeptidase
MPLLPETAAVRRARLAALVAEADAAAALVTRLVNVRYLTGLASSNAAVLVGADGTTVLATDGRYATLAAQTVPDVELVVSRPVAKTLAERAAHRGIRRFTFEEHDVTVELYATLREAASSSELVSGGHAVERLREVKDEDEIALLREACAIGDRALAELLPRVRTGLTERQVAVELEQRMRDNGGDGVAFETIAASGPNSAVPHHRPTTRVIEPGDFLKLDFGSIYEGYHADMTRTFVVGAEPAQWQRDVYDLVARAQAAGRAALAPGVDVRDLDTAARSVVEEAGQGEHFPHGLGHGVGLEIHEAPTVGYAATGTLTAGTPVTVEPGVYLPDRGGVRIEDTLVVREGAPELLTTSPRDLLVLGR